MDEFQNIEPEDILFFHPLCKLNPVNMVHNREQIVSRQSIKLLTYNIFLRPPPVKNNEDDYKNERMEDFCKVIHNFDIICLQEMFGTFNSRKQSLIRHATRRGFFFYVDTSSPSFANKYLADGGLLILSRFPIYSFAFSPYRYGVLADSLAEKGVLYAKILVKNSAIHLFTTHLQASYLDDGDMHFRVSCETRMEQIRHINYVMCEVLKNDYEKGDKIILAGDFNVDANKYQFKTPEGLIDKDKMKMEYDDMMQILSSNGITAIDTFLINGKRPITYGDYDEDTGKRETALTHKDDIGCRLSLDYVFECYYNEPPTDDTKSLTIDKNSLRVEKFFVDQTMRKVTGMTNKKYSQLSDHYGLSCEIVYQGESQGGEVSKYVEEYMSEEQKAIMEKL